MLQGLNRFLLDRIAADYATMASVPTPVEETLATMATSNIKCATCKGEWKRPGSTYVNDLLYPTTVSWSDRLRGNSVLTHLKRPPGRNGRTPRTTFSQILKSSVERETTQKGWCIGCHKYQPMSTRKTIHSVPKVLMLNTAITTADHRALWSTPGWLPEEIGIIVEQGQFFCYEGEDLKLHLQRGIHNITVYSLIGMAINIESGQAQKPHLVAMVNGRIIHL